MGWFEFVLAVVVFFAAHAIPVRPKVKARLVENIGPRGFSMAYSAVSLIILAWIIVAAGRAPFVEIWSAAPWHKHVALTLMLVAVLLLSLGIARPNPLSFGGARNDRFDANAPGIVAWVRHPLLAAICLWASAHLIANGALAHVILFGLFAGFSVLGMRIIDRRNRRLMGADWPAPGTFRREIQVTRQGVARLVIGCVTYGVLVVIHAPVIGVNPLP